MGTAHHTEFVGKTRVNGKSYKDMPADQQQLEQGLMEVKAIIMPEGRREA